MVRLCKLIGWAHAIKCRLRPVVAANCPEYDAVACSTNTFVLVSFPFFFRSNLWKKAGPLQMGVTFWRRASSTVWGPFSVRAVRLLFHPLPRTRNNSTTHRNISAYLLYFSGRGILCHHFRQINPTGPPSKVWFTTKRRRWAGG